MGVKREFKELNDIHQIHRDPQAIQKDYGPRTELKIKRVGGQDVRRVTGAKLWQRVTQKSTLRQGWGVAGLSLLFQLSVRS